MIQLLEQADKERKLTQPRAAILKGGHIMKTPLRTSKRGSSLHLAIRLLIFMYLVSVLPLRAQVNFWTPLGDPHAGGISALSLDSTKSIVVGTDSMGVFRSTDLGRTWVSIQSGMTNLHITALCVTPSGAYLAAAHDGRLYRSSNLGASWDVVHTIFAGWITAFATRSEDTVYYGALFGGICKSTNDGQTWNWINRDFLNSFPISDMLVDPVLGRLHFCGSQGVAWTSDEISWSFFFVGTTALAWSPLLIDVYSVGDPGIGRVATDLAIDGYDRRFVGTQDSGVFCSNQHGARWTSLNSGLDTSLDIRQLCYGDSSLLYVGTADGKLFRSAKSTLGLLPPLPLLPSLGAMNVGFPVALEWRTSYTAQSYHAVVYADSLNGGVIAYDSSGILDTNVSIPDLDSLRYYYWQLTAMNGEDTSEFSAPLWFHTGPPPRAPALISPSDSSFDGPLEVHFQWHASPTADYYILSIGTDIVPFPATNHVVHDTTFTLTVGLNGWKFYWSVTGVNNLVGQGAYAPLRVYWTLRNAPVGPPTLLAPANRSVFLVEPVFLRWNKRLDSDLFDVQVSMDSTFTNLAYSDTSSSDTFKIVSGLARGATYFWRGRGKNPGGTGPWSTPFRFTTAPHPATPDLISPINGSIQSSRNVTFRWRRSVANTSYDWQVSTDSLFVTLTFADSSIFDTTTKVDVLGRLTTYYWRTRGRNPSGTSLWSRPLSFETMYDTSCLYQLRAKWNLISVPLRLVNSRMDKLFPTAIAPVYAYREGYVKVDSLKKGEGYWLRSIGVDVRSLSGSLNARDTFAVVEGWNLVGSLTTPLPIGQAISEPPGIVSSAVYGYRGSYVLTDTFRSGFGYWVHASQPGVLILDGSPSAEYNFPNSARRAVSSISSVAQVLARQFHALTIEDAGGNSQTLYYSLREHDEIPGLTDIQLPPPAQDAEFDARFKSNRLIAIRDSSESKYEIEITAEHYPLEISWVKQSDIVSDGSAQLVFGKRWCAIGPNGGTVTIQGEVNPGGLFLELVADSSHRQGIPYSFSLSQNYPNPFNPSTEIVYHVGEQNNVSLKIVDILGREIAEVVNEVQLPGEYRIVWDASKLPSGLYVYRLQSGRHSATRKMLLLK